MIPRSFGYEPNDFTTCPLCNKYGQVGLAHKRPITRRLDRNIGATGGDRIHDVSYVAVFETAPSQPSCGTVAYSKERKFPLSTLHK